MRLIDADKLETTAVLGVQLQHADSRYYYFYEEETIEKAPTVKAIPIDWLVTKAKEMVLTQGTKFYSILDLPIVYDLIEEWRKENETDRCG